MISKHRVELEIPYHVRFVAAMAPVVPQPVKSKGPLLAGGPRAASPLPLSIHQEHSSGSCHMTRCSRENTDTLIPADTFAAYSHQVTAIVDYEKP